MLIFFLCLSVALIVIAYWIQTNYLVFKRVVVYIYLVSKKKKKKLLQLQSVITEALAATQHANKSDTATVTRI